MPKQAIIVLTTGFLSLGCLLAGDDIASDGGLAASDLSGPPVSLGAKDSDKAKALSLYSEAYLQGSGKGSFGLRGIESLFKALDLDPDSRELVRTLLAELIKANSVKSNLDRLKDLAAKHPDSLSLANTISDVLQAEGRPDDALKIVSGAIDSFRKGPKEPQDKEALSMAASKLALLQAMKGRFEDADDAIRWASEEPSLAKSLQVAQAAIAVYSSALRDAPESSFKIPWLMTDKKDEYAKKLAASIDSFVRIAFDEPRISPSLYQTAMNILAANGRSQDVRRMLLSNLLTNPADQETSIALANLYSSLGENASACRAWKRAFAIGVKPSPQYYLSYGMAARLSKNLQEAANAFEWCLLIDSANELAALELSWTYYEMRQIRKCLSKLERLKPSSDVLYLKALCLDEFKKHAEALDTLLKSEELADADAKARLDDRGYRFICATFAEKARRPDIVERKILPLIERNPDDAEALNFLGYTLAEMGLKLDDAERYIRRAVGLDPKNQAILDSMAWILYKKGQPKEALPWMEKSIDAAEGSPDAVISDHAGDIYSALGDKANALKFWRLALETHSDETDPAAIAAKIAAAEGGEPKAKPKAN